MSGEITTAEQLLALPLGTKLLDKDQDVVTRQGFGVGYPTDYLYCFVTASKAMRFAPFTVVTEQGDPVEDQR